jgi:hypothetical protein
LKKRHFSLLKMVHKWRWKWNLKHK